MGSPSVYVVLLLVNELSCFSQWLSRTELGGKTKLNARRKKAESERSHVALPETNTGCWMEPYPASHSHVAIHRLTEMD